MNRLAATAAILLCGSCGSDSTATTPPVQQPAALVVSGPPSFQVLAGQPATASVRVLAAGGQPLSGVGVHFTPSAGGGVSATTQITDADGVATVQWTTAKTVGDQTLDAAIPNTFYKQQFIAEVSASLAGTWSGSFQGGTFAGGLLWVCADVTTPFKYSCQGDLTSQPSGNQTHIVLTGSITGALFAMGSGAQGYNGTMDAAGKTITGEFTGGIFFKQQLTLVRQ